MLAQESAIQDCSGLWTELQTQKLKLMEAVLVGNYDANVALNSKVSTPERYY
jgi:hypothetical protein